MTSAQCLCDQQTVVELHLHASSGYPINIVSKPATGYTVRVSATHLPTEVMINIIKNNSEPYALWRF